MRAMIWFVKERNRPV